jgi:dihydrofolate reductase
MSEIIIIAAMAKNRVIGKDNKIPWSIKKDMAHFRELTTGWPCIMGRKTWESLPKKPLPGRPNIVVSKTMTKTPQNVKVFFSLPEAVEYCASYEKVFICGGETLYKQALEIANKIELTLIHKEYDGDTFFPEIDPSIWVQASTTKFDAYSFLTYTRYSD